ncbi:TerB family tellurite resistance protein [Rubripirellula amarantea]|nr:TerB family tellurite resistance protein [Rubripirellula amarantea]
MILIGTMNLTRTRDTGNFYCPTCSVDQTYRLRSRRPFLTLYFIPTVPVGAAELFVQCDQCRSTWDVSVLEMDKETHEMAIAEQFRTEAIRASVLVTLVDGTISEEEINGLLKVSRGVLDYDLDREELGHLCSVARQNQIEATNYVLTVSRRWTQEQKMKAIEAMFLAATVDPEMSDVKLQVLAKMREVLDLTDREYQTAIERGLDRNDLA